MSTAKRPDPTVHLDLDPVHWARATIEVLGKALQRLWGRDVMLYVGGVSFWIMLAVFPLLVIAVGLYGLLLTPEQVAHQAEVLARMLPSDARGMFQDELQRLAHAPSAAVSTQSVIALFIGGYAAHRGYKALLAGLSFIHDEENQRGFVSFNVMALLVLIASLVLVGLVSVLFLGLRVASAAWNLRPLAGLNWLYSEWTWTSICMLLAMSLIYRFAMSREPVAWRASIAGGVASAVLALVASWLCAIYVEQIAHLGATYGSVGTVVVFLIWLSWNVNALFFGGALATEMEIALHTRKIKPVLKRRKRAPPR
ncbi:MAG TPA: YihY/virulence factor BrkB family protein [Caulobacter sp.]|nr:YihY/virulence factor BrkB family protein [Caulobacter sp.]